MRLRALPLMLALGLVVSAACSGHSNLNQSARPVSNETTGETPIVILEPAAPPSLPVTVTSADGREVTVSSVDRILPLWGGLSEIVFGLGLGDNVVGRDVTATFPEVSGLPLVTIAHDVSAEGVLSLKPTIVLATPETGPANVLELIAEAGIPVVKFRDPASTEEVLPHIRAVAAALGVPESGEKLAAWTEDKLASISALIPQNSEPPRVAFLYMRGQAGVFLIGGPKSGADSMITAAGAIDAGTAMGLTRPFSPITVEAMIKSAPDVLLMTTTGLASVGGIEGLLKVAGVAETPAGKNRRVVTLEDGLLYSFGARTPAALEELVKKIYQAPQ